LPQSPAAGKFSFAIRRLDAAADLCAGLSRAFTTP